MCVQARKKSADEKLQLLNKLLVGIKSGLETVSGFFFLIHLMVCFLFVVRDRSV